MMIGRLLHYWLEKGSRIMTLCPGNNPLSFPLLTHLTSNPSLLLNVQRLSAGQEHFFQASSLTTCLQEGGLTIQALRHEITDPGPVKPPSVLAIFPQSVSWTWTEDHPDNYSKEHLLAGRTLLERMLDDPEKRHDRWYNLCSAGTYFDTIQTSRGSSHPTVGFSAGLFYLIACLGRRCWLVMETGVKDPILDATFEGQLLTWEPEHDDQNLVHMSIGYRKHGLIMLYTICGIPIPVSDPSSPAKDSVTGAEGSGPRIRGLTMGSLGRLFRTSVDAPYLSFHSTPLLTAAVEPTAEDAQLRINVVGRFKAIYCTNRVAVNMWAIELLQKLWDLPDCGVHVTWLELLISKEWTFTFA
ncbi:unnamed protein product [Penicillium egyptiacum]|uniref:Uncharacterized protein n=1 Tax=Penicillium egyptiacum TaxID=1303716 RepID=A0A9W4K3P0_9EURO|nr:unnamed protein product [Penicillium egyptiacum]